MITQCVLFGHKTITITISRILCERNYKHVMQKKFKPGQILENND